MNNTVKKVTGLLLGTLEYLQATILTFPFFQMPKKSAVSNTGGTLYFCGVQARISVSHISKLHQIEIFLLGMSFIIRSAYELMFTLSELGLEYVLSSSFFQ